MQNHYLALHVMDIPSLLNFSMDLKESAAQPRNAGHTRARLDLRAAGQLLRAFRSNAGSIQIKSDWIMRGKLLQRKIDRSLRV